MSATGLQQPVSKSLMTSFATAMGHVSCDPVPKRCPPEEDDPTQTLFPQYFHLSSVYYMSLWEGQCPSRRSKSSAPRLFCLR
jgi:hypothetical protein